jgi:SAM-dependent methyltransferase
VGLNGLPTTVAELGPGDSLGIGLAALLSGSEHYYGFDVVKHSNNERNLNIFDELVELFKQKASIPDAKEFPNIFPLLENYDFPYGLLTQQILDRALNPVRTATIRSELANPSAASNKFIRYFAPWSDERLIQPASVDLIFSQFVLEHVNELEPTYAALYKWLKPGGLTSHMIDFRCHGTAEKWNGQWAYSDFMWKLIKGGRPFLLNREPFSMHTKLIEKFGFKIVGEKKYTAADGLERKQLAFRFANLSDEDLTVWGIFIQAKK